MTEIQLTNIQFAQLQLDNLVAKDKPYIESWSAGDVGSFNAILNAVDFAMSSRITCAAGHVNEL